MPTLQAGIAMPDAAQQGLAVCCTQLLYKCCFRCRIIFEAGIETDHICYCMAMPDSGEKNGVLQKTGPDTTLLQTRGAHGVTGVRRFTWCYDLAFTWHKAYLSIMDHIRRCNLFSLEIARMCQITHLDYHCQLCLTRHKRAKKAAAVRLCELGFAHHWLFPL